MEGSYETGLALLSLLVAVLTSYTALTLAARVASTRQSTATTWLLGGALTMGGGIWAMHFIGMLAFRLPIRMAYDPWLTGASLLLAVITSGVALSVVSRLAVISETEVDPPIIVAGGVLMGAGICGMHYTGMAAMRMTPEISYSPLLFVASMLIAVTASIVGLALAFFLRGAEPGRRLRTRGGAALVMGLAITGMHYTGMAAARFAPESYCAVNTAFDVDNESLGFGIAVMMLAVLSLTIALALAPADARRQGGGN